jgi:hypothetical protein
LRSAVPTPHAVSDNRASNPKLKALTDFITWGVCTHCSAL